MKEILFFILMFFWISLCIAQMSGMSMGHHHEMRQEEEKELVPSGELKDGVREVEVKAFQYGFSPDPIIVNKGEKIRLKVTSTDVTHGILIPEYKINVTLPPGETKVVEFLADKEGEFMLHCSVYCGIGHGRMHGRLIVR
ncbi:MAG: cupredoxin domain-containing protein [Candidatus Omnitrophica bacterium]|nr:cupredoxin domain-containing protein [Candidatus Omnitrophota bacterium]MCM8793023.1 cupredoxin domain-containing protein [Candidatus Omnitrophota bacterium]